jgi:hypothetical protein
VLAAAKMPDVTPRNTPFEAGKTLRLEQVSTLHPQRGSRKRLPNNVAQVEAQKCQPVSLQPTKTSIDNGPVVLAPTNPIRSLLG